MITIKNLRKEKPKNEWDVKVCRTKSPLGNPFILYDVNDNVERDTVCNLYEDWFYSNLEKDDNKREIKRLISLYKKYHQLNLFCWCAPKRCHAEVIKNYIERAIDNERAGIIVDIFDESVFAKKYPIEYAFCRDALAEKNVYFGECYRVVFDKFLNVYYNYDDNEDMTASFLFDNNHNIYEMELTNMD